MTDKNAGEDPPHKRAELDIGERQHIHNEAENQPARGVEHHEQQDLTGVAYDDNSR